MIFHLFEPPLPEVPADLLELCAVQGDVAECLAELARDPQDREVTRVETLWGRLQEPWDRGKQGSLKGVVDFLLLWVSGGKVKEVLEVEGEGFGEALGFGCKGTSGPSEEWNLT